MRCCSASEKLLEPFGAVTDRFEGRQSEKLFVEKVTKGVHTIGFSADDVCEKTWIAGRLAKEVEGALAGSRPAEVWTELAREHRPGRLALTHNDGSWQR